jgi:hypothetical protein
MCVPIRAGLCLGNGVGVPKLIVADLSFELTQGLRQTRTSGVGHAAPQASKATCRPHVKPRAETRRQFR